MLSSFSYDFINNQMGRNELQNFDCSLIHIVWFIILVGRKIICELILGVFIGNFVVDKVYYTRR